MNALYLCYRAHGWPANMARAKVRRVRREALAIKAAEEREG